LLDAMACGAAIVASDVGDAREILGDTGLLVPPDSPGALMEALTSLRDADLRNRLGSAAEARYSAAFALGTWQAVMAEIVGSALAGTRALPGVAT
jgi:glycosyltransferase involved in cell wall biosynthesis